MYLLDTNVVSELRKREGIADPHVAEWAERHHADELFISVVTVLEIEIGVARLERRDPVQGATLRGWLDDGVLAGFVGRILPVTLDVARCAAPMHVPDPRSERDAWIAATAMVHGLSVVTRNVADFDDSGLTIIDPWRAA